jgi:predicted RNase H-like HicB family nuclease
MSNVVFAARVSPNPPNGYLATFPDIPDLSVAGADPVELLQNGRRILAAHLQSLSDAGEEWPTASSIETVTAGAGEVIILVDVAVDDRPIRVNVSLGERLVQRLDAAAEARGMTRSGFIAQAVRVSLGEKPAAAPDFDAVGRRLQDELTAFGRKLNDALGPESAFSRRMAEFDDQIYDGVRRAADSVSAAMAKRRGAQGETTAERKEDAA